jgi:plasmid stabilization system protein ParE
VKTLQLAPEAVDELSDAAKWYADRAPGVEQRFLNEVERLLHKLTRRPRSFPLLPEMPEDVEVRRAKTARFPYVLVFIELDEEIRVLAVAHNKRRPGYWLDRLLSSP